MPSLPPNLLTYMEYIPSKKIIPNQASERIYEEQGNLESGQKWMMKGQCHVDAPENPAAV